MEENKMSMPVVQDAGKGEVTINFFANEANFNLGQRMAKVFASSNLVPVQYHNNIGNVMIAMNMSQRMGADPLMVMQNLVIVHNQPTFEAKFAIACFNATGKYTPIRYEEVGEKGKDSWGMYAYAIDKSTGDVLKGPEITIKLAKDEGWYDKNPKWRNVPQLMLRYRSASWFIRTTDPGVMMGFQTSDEVEDAQYVEVHTNTPTGVVETPDANAVAIDMDNIEQNDAPADNAKNASETHKKPADNKVPNEDKKPRENAKETKQAQSSDSSEGVKNESKTAPTAEPIGKQPTPDLFK